VAALHKQQSPLVAALHKRHYLPPHAPAISGSNVVLQLCHGEGKRLGNDMEAREDDVPLGLRLAHQLCIRLPDSAGPAPPPSEHTRTPP
jgi:hypothetical protein